MCAPDVCGECVRDWVRGANRQTCTTCVFAAHHMKMCWLCSRCWMCVSMHTHTPHTQAHEQKCKKRCVDTHRPVVGSSVGEHQIGHTPCEHARARSGACMQTCTLGRMHAFMHSGTRAYRHARMDACIHAPEYACTFAVPAHTSTRTNSRARRSPASASMRKCIRANGHLTRYKHERC